MNDFIAVTQDQLGETLGASILCPRCGNTHPIEKGKSRRLTDAGWVDEEDGKLSFYRCGKRLYLCGIDGRTLK